MVSPRHQLHVFCVTTPPASRPDDRPAAVIPFHGRKMEVAAMTGQTTSDYESEGREATAGGWATGLTVFAGVMMIMAGAFQAFAGLVALFENEFYFATRNYLLQF